MHNVVAIFAAFELSCLRWGAKVSSGGSIESSGGVCALLERDESNEDVKGRKFYLREGWVE